MTIIRDLLLYLIKAILKHSVKLRLYILCGDVAACHRSVCVCVLCSCKAHKHIIYNDVILLSVLI